MKAEDIKIAPKNAFWASSINGSLSGEQEGKYFS